MGPSFVALRWPCRDLGMGVVSLLALPRCLGLALPAADDAGSVLELLLAELGDARPNHDGWV